jgi:hypothetical protein
MTWGWCVPVPAEAAWEAANAEFFGILNQFKPRVLFIHDFVERRASVPDMVASSVASCPNHRNGISRWAEYQRHIQLVSQTAIKYV